MITIINSNEELPIATDKECYDRRNFLIASGVIKPNKSNITSKKNTFPIISTRKMCKIRREELIRCGIIQPIKKLNDGSITFCELPRKENSKLIVKDEGEYKSRPIKSDKEYYRRRQAYFRMIQEIIYSRKDLKLILNKRKDDDPDWYF